jgi:hypothetical protein
MADKKAKTVKSLLRGKSLALHTTHRACIERENNEQIAHDDAVENTLKLKEIWVLSIAFEPRTNQTLG